MEQTPLRTPFSPDRSRLVPLALDYTRLPRPKPNRTGTVRRLSRGFPPVYSFVTDSDKANVLHRSIKFELNSVKCQTLVLLQG